MTDIDPKWLEVSLTVDGEMAESVAEIMARYISSGVVVESTAVDTSDPYSEGHAVGPLRVTGYIPIDEHLEAIRQRLEEALWYLSRIRPLPAAEFRTIQEANWVETWKQHYHPIPIGEKLMIIPAWLSPESGGRLPIRIDPGMAFGTGTHPTTRLCLELVEMIQGLASDPEETEVIDLGCGSGILSIGALRLGARRALGVDIDPQAVKAASENARLNAVDERLELGVGSLSSIQAGEYSMQKASLVLANILAPVILSLLEQDMGDLLTPGGHLVLSGILEGQAPEVEAALAKKGMQIVERRMFEDWVAIHARPSI